MKGLEDIWWPPSEGKGAGPLLAALAAGEVLFRGAVAARAALYRLGIAHAARAEVPVVSIGNLAVGGAGKTPVALEVATRLKAKGWKVAVLSRGYGARRKDARIVTRGGDPLLSAADAGDEPLILARRLPGCFVLCGPKRTLLARMAVHALGAEVLVLDDGFQHRSLARDLDIVVLDATDPYGNGHLLPRGPNRESPRALGRAQLAWLTRVDRASPETLGSLRETACKVTGRAPVESRHEVVDVLDGLLGRSLGRGALKDRGTLLLCALARPGSFRATAAGLGAKVLCERVFRDHHLFTEDEVNEALRAAEAAGCEVVATTEKDAVRLPARLAGDARFRVVRIDAQVVGGGAVLDGLLEEVMRTRKREGLAILP
ncbi:MAG TPA: tetraacyldisaccharide 4'-kinase [Anaeromyxobacteraceae bacterium]|nr:tetraacyldisaccharide 4'-kinase [Anaeromyxobacteraceae bacterium]